MNEPLFTIDWWMAASIGVIFVFAGVRKLNARDLWPAQAKRLGAPGFAIPTVPYVELVLGSLLIAGLASTVTLVASIGALSSFTVLLLSRLLAGDRPPCACLSFRATKPIGWNNIVRNLLMLALLVAALIR
jgi:uncharacterized membrane protein YphA (DoxX/SURF4 family)